MNQRQLETILVATLMAANWGKELAVMDGYEWDYIGAEMVHGVIQRLDSYSPAQVAAAMPCAERHLERMIADGAGGIAAIPGMVWLLTSFDWGERGRKA